VIASIEARFPDFWMEGRQRMVLIQSIANAIKQAQAEVWAEVKQQCEIMLDIGKGKV